LVANLPDSWCRSTVAQARAQDISDVLDPLFKPVPAEKDLFEAKQKYMYAVFERVLWTDKDKALVRSNEADANAQKIFNKLCISTGSVASTYVNVYIRNF